MPNARQLDFHSNASRQKRENNRNNRVTSYRVQNNRVELCTIIALTLAWFQPKTRFQMDNRLNFNLYKKSVTEPKMTPIEMPK